MLLSNDQIELKLQKKLGRIPQPVEFLKFFIHSRCLDLIKLENEARLRKDYTFPNIFSSTLPQKEIVSNIEDYVLYNLKDYVEMHKVNVKKIDYTKVTYWVGMYIFEILNSSYGIEFLQKEIQKEIYKDTKCKLDDMMIVKMNDISKYKKVDKIANQTHFFRYYGRFGLYHSLKQSHRTLSLLCLADS